MRRRDLTRLLALSSLLAEGSDLLVVGSQAILGSRTEDDLPPVAVASVEADLTLLDGDEEKADLIDAMLGEDSAFHRDSGYYAQGVGVTTAILPDGWRYRLVAFPADLPGGSKAWCLEVHDLTAAKLVAMREKDLVYVSALANAGQIDLDVLEDRVDALPADRVSPEVRSAVLNQIKHMRATRG